MSLFGTAKGYNQPRDISKITILVPMVVLIKAVYELARLSLGAVASQNGNKNIMRCNGTTLCKSIHTFVAPDPILYSAPGSLPSLWPLAPPMCGWMYARRFTLTMKGMMVRFVLYVA